MFSYHKEWHSCNKQFKRLQLTEDAIYFWDFVFKIFSFTKKYHIQFKSTKHHDLRKKWKIVNIWLEPLNLWVSVELHLILFDKYFISSLNLNEKFVFHWRANSTSFFNSFPRSWTKWKYFTKKFYSSSKENSFCFCCYKKFFQIFCVFTIFISLFLLI